MYTHWTLGFLCIIFSLVLFRPHTGHTQDLDVIGVHYDTTNGLLDNNVIDGVVDDNGSLWLATARGLSSFDGNRFINFTSEDSVYRISSNKIRAITFSGGYVYIAADSTIDRINIQTKVVKRIPYVHKKGLIRHLISGINGKIYAISDSGDLVEIQSGESLFVGFGALDYFHTFNAKTNTILLSNAKSDYIARINLTTFKVENYWKKQRDQRLRTFGLVASNTYGFINLLNTGATSINEETGEEAPLWDTSRIITSYNPNLNDFEVFVSQFNDIQLRNPSGRVTPVRLSNSGQNRYKKILTDKKRTVFALHDRGFAVFRVPPNFLESLPTERLTNIEPNVLYKSMLELPDNNIIIFTYDGIAEYDPSTNGMRLVSQQHTNHVSGTLVNQSLFVVNDGLGLLEYDRSTFEFIRHHRIDTSGIYERAYTLLKESDDELIIGYAMPMGVWRFSTQNGRFERIPIEFKPSDSVFEAVNSITKDDNGHYWVASNQGLYHLDGDWNTIRVYSSSETDSESKISTSKINQVLKDSNSTLWVATDNGLYAKYPDREKLVEITAFSGQVIASIEHDHYGRLWVATYLGLVVYDHKTNGLNRFYQEDGFPDDEYNIGSHLKGSDNMLYFGGINGVAQVNPSKWVLDNQGLSLQLSSVLIERVDGTQLVDFNPAFIEPIYISGYSDALTIQVSFMDYINPAYSTYRYRLSDFNEQWMSFDYGTLRLRNLPVGKYFIEIVGTHASGMSMDKPIRIPIVVTQPFIQSVYFPIVVIIVILTTVIVFLYNNYSHKIELRAVRANLLNDIQDELGGILSKAAMKAELMQPAESSNSNEFNELQHLMREGVQSLRNSLWSLSSERSTTMEFQDRITEWLDFVFHDSGFEFSFQNKAPGMQFNLSIQQRRQLIPIIRELALNTIKHSSGNQFHVMLDKQKKNFRLTVYDNGRNLDDTVTASGYGLIGIAERVERLSGTVTFEKNPDGFKTTILF